MNGYINLRAIATWAGHLEDPKSVGKIEKPKQHPQKQTLHSTMNKKTTLLCHQELGLTERIQTHFCIISELSSD